MTDQTVQQHAGLSSDTDALESIHRLLDGHKWRGGDDLLAIADILCSAGFDIGAPGQPAGPRPDPHEVDHSWTDDGTGHCKICGAAGDGAEAGER